MKVANQLLAAAAVTLLAAVPAAAQITTTSSNNANVLATSLQGSGVTFTSANLTTTTENGLFNNGAAGVGINSGVVLTTGTLSCVSPSNDSGSCSGSGVGSSLTLGFVATSASLFFNYVFASEEYPEFVGSSFNDSFSLTLNGTNYSNVNLAQVPGGGGSVTINNVNATSNSAFYRSNSGATSLNLPIEFDGLTTLLTASATNLVIGSAYTLTFSVQDVGDSSYDSAVFIQGGSVGTVTPPPPVAGAAPEPGTWGMMILGFGAVGFAMRRAVRRSEAKFDAKIKRIAAGALA